MERNELCWCGSGKKYKRCHMAIEEKMEQLREAGHIVPERELLKTPAQIEAIKKSAELNTAVLDHVAAHIHAGMSTEEIDVLVHDFTVSHGAVNERAERIVRVTEECVELGLKAAKPWGHLGDIADAINTHAQKNGYSVVEDIGGHGIGLEFHEEPFVSYVTPKGSEMVLVPGMMFTIEPMINEGSPDFFVDEDNDWTVYTIDDGLSAQIEYMVLVTETGIEVLTK